MYDEETYLDANVISPQFFVYSKYYNCSYKTSKWYPVCFSLFSRGDAYERGMGTFLLHCVLTAGKTYETKGCKLLQFYLNFHM